MYISCTDILQFTQLRCQAVLVEIWTGGRRFGLHLAPAITQDIAIYHPWVMRHDPIGIASNTVYDSNV